MRILVVDDERQITRVLRTSLQSSGYEVVVAHDGVQALALFEEAAPDLIITDLGMPEMDGIEFTREIRRVSDTPILVLSVRETERQKVAALDSGADDYITKPFSMPELLARVRANLRKAASAPEPAQLALGDFFIDAEAHNLTVRGEPLHLTPKEFALLLFFLRNPLRVLTHKALLKHVWGPSGIDQPEYLRVLIAQLRKKLDDGSGRRYIESEPWIGYRFHPTAQTELTTS